MRDLIPADPSIRLIQLASYLEIGGKRNYGCERAIGQVIAHWDDDDYSAPGRLQDQVTRLIESGKAVTGYHRMLFRGSMEAWVYEATRNRMVVGTSLMYWRDWWNAHRFPAKQIGEDNEFGDVAAAAEQLETEDARDLMYATIHMGNTSPRQLSGPNWKQL